MLDLEQEMSRCRVCPRKCGADREHGKTGYCKAPSGVAAARAALHFWEERVFPGRRGRGRFSFPDVICGVFTVRTIILRRWRAEK